MARMSISRRIVAQGGRLPVENFNQRVLGPQWFTLSGTVTDHTATSIDLTAAAAWNGSNAARGTFSNTAQSPDAICHIESYQVVYTSNTFHAATAANKGALVSGTYLKAQIGGSLTQYDSIRGSFEIFGSNATTASTTTLNRVMGMGPIILPTPLRVDLLDDQLTLEAPAVNFGANVNLEVHDYGWLYPRTMADSIPSEDGCAPGTVTVERARQLNSSFQQQLLTSVLS